MDGAEGWPPAPGEGAGGQGESSRSNSSGSPSSSSQSKKKGKEKVGFEEGDVGEEDDVSEEVDDDESLAEVPVQVALKVMDTEEDVNAFALIGDEVSLEDYAKELEIISPVMMNKIMLLSEQYYAARKVLNDGNSFFRGFLFAYLEYLMVICGIEEAARFISRIESMKQNFVLALSSFYVKENLPVLLNLLRDLLPGSSIPLSYELLLNINEENSDFIVSWFRYITSTQIRQQEGYYSSIISAYDCGSVQEFCAKTVEPMGIDCEQLQIMAFAEAMGVQIRIIYVDGYNANSLPNHEDYPSTGAGTSSSAAASSSVDDFHSDEPQVALVFINGHYDIIYRC